MEYSIELDPTVCKAYSRVTKKPNKRLHYKGFYENFETIVENALAANWKTAVEAMNNKNNPRHVCKVMALKMWHECQHEKLNRGFRFELATL